jgi:nitrogenase-associated protein
MAPSPTQVVFFEKPGCKNNTRQKALLRAAGHTVEDRNLLTTPWTADTLRPYFGDRPVAEWFNKAAPAVTSGEIDPSIQTADSALALMIAQPLLIRRPLMEARGEKRCGFDMESVDAWIGLATAVRKDVETCPKSHHDDPEPCPPPPTA